VSLDVAVKTNVVDDNDTSIEVDANVNALVSIDVAHREVHDGKAFILSYIDTDSDQVSASVLVGTMPVSGEYHFNFSVVADATGRLELREGVLHSGGGVATIEYNANREVRTSSIVNFQCGVNFLSGQGTVLWNGLIGASNNKSHVGGDVKNGFEWIMTSGDIAVLFYPDADNTKCVINAEWYEVE
jgi:hypothetical protein